MVIVIFVYLQAVSS